MKKTNLLIQDAAFWTRPVLALCLLFVAFVGLWNAGAAIVCTVAQAKEPSCPVCTNHACPAPWTPDGKLPDGVLPITSGGVWIVPNPALTPGSIDPTHTEEWLEVRGHIKEARQVTWSTKQRVFERYGIPKAQRTGKMYEIDHAVPIELGGSENEDNLWPEPRTGDWNAWLKDRLEDKLHYLVEHKCLTLQQAQTATSGRNWPAAWQHYVGAERTR